MELLGRHGPDDRQVYDALKNAGADEDKARAAATALAGQWELDARFDQIDARFDRIEARLDRLESRFDGRFERLEARVTKPETDMTVLKWMVGANIGLTILVLGRLLLP